MTTDKSQQPAHQRMQPLCILEGAACTPLYTHPAGRASATVRTS